MKVLLSILISSFIINSLLFIPYINLLYKIKFQRRRQKTKDVFGLMTPIFDKFNRKKAGVPVGGGLLIVFTTLILFGIAFALLYYFWYPLTSNYSSMKDEIKILLFTFLSFAVIGLYDDIRKTFFLNKDLFFGLRLKHKLLLETILSFIIAFLTLSVLADLSLFKFKCPNYKFSHNWSY